MANNFITPQIVAREAVMILVENLVAAAIMSRGHQIELTGQKVGDTVKIIVPMTFTQRDFDADGGTVTVQDASEAEVDLVVEKHFDITFALTSKQMTLELDEFSDRIIKPAMVAHARGLDSYLLSKYTGVYQTVGTAGDPPDAWADVVSVGKAADDALMPSERFAILDSQAKHDLMLIDEFHHADKRGDGGAAQQRAELGDVYGINWLMDQQVSTACAHTKGTEDAAYLVNGVAAIGAKSLPVDTGTGTLVVGDILTLATSNQGQNFVVTAPYAGGAGNVAIEPGLVEATTDDEAITVLASHTSNLLLHPNAFTWALVPLEEPRGAAESAIINVPGVGGVRVVFDYNSTTKKDQISLDFLVGCKLQQPELATRILG